MSFSDLKRLNQIAQAIYDKKGANIIALDVREISTLTEYYVIAEGNVEKHVSAIARSLIDQQKTEGFSPTHIEGAHKGDWVVIDFGYIVVHLFEPNLREKYALENLWQKGKIVDLQIEVEKKQGTYD